MVKLFFYHQKLLFFKKMKYIFNITSKLNKQQMEQIKQQLEEYSPLYSILVDLVTGFLEPCLDYDVPKCNHKIAHCVCGNIFEFRHPLYPAHARGKRVLVEKFCPYCGAPNKHNSPDSPNWLQQGWRILPSTLEIPFLSRQLSSNKSLSQHTKKKYLNCSWCATRAESYDHKYCTKCQHKLTWSAWPCTFQPCC